METNSKPQNHNQSPIFSPNSDGDTSMSTAAENSSNNDGGGGGGIPYQVSQATPLTLKSISRSDHQANSYPRTFVQANTSTFKQVVQMLTGSSGTAKSPQPSSSKPNPDSISNKISIPPIKSFQKKQHQGFKLYERRNQQRNKLIINPLTNNGGIINSAADNSRNHEILSPSMLDFPNLLVLSPDTPLKEETFNNYNKNSSSKCSSSLSLASSSSEEEDKAIAEKGFYLHPSPINTPRECEPQLLSLFPVTSP